MTKLLKYGESQTLSDGTLIERLPTGVIVVHNETTRVVPVPPKLFKRIMLDDLDKKEIKILQGWMRPKGMSTSGFLSKRESLKRVIARDNETLNKLGVTHEQIADELEAKLKEANKRLRDSKGGIERGINGNKAGELAREVVFGEGGKYRARPLYYMGSQDCPFERLPRFSGVKVGEASSDMTLVNQRLGKGVFFSELHIHLLRYHHFFEGHSRYRLEPNEVVQVLEM